MVKKGLDPTLSVVKSLILSESAHDVVLLELGVY